MKERATVVCWHGDRILLVIRDSSRWALPGGTIQRTKSPFEAARRELEEYAGLALLDLVYRFEFSGLGKRHYVFSVSLGVDVEPESHNEISVCAWFSPSEMASLSVSIPTCEIVRLSLEAVVGGSVASNVSLI